MKNLLIAIISIVIVGGAAAQSPKASEQSKRGPVKKKHGAGTILQSHSKQVGNIGPYQVHSIRLRGLDSPNVTAAILFDTRNESITVIGPATGAGLGSAILGAAGNVGSSAVFGASLRPTRINENISNNSASEGSSAKSISEGGEATSVSLSEGGDSTAVSVSDADARSSSSSKNHNKVTSQNTNVNSNQQSQGQAQAQGQIQGQSNSNSNSRKNGNGPKDKD